jgi:predicted nucleic acid-binding protein
MTLLDAGPFIGMLDHRDESHALCREVFRELDDTFLTTLPVLTEVFHFLGERAGRRKAASAQDRLWQFVNEGLVSVAAGSADGLRRAASLMRTYSDLPMDFADATLVALAEERKITRVFTLDRHFRAYRLHGRRAFEIVPD